MKIQWQVTASNEWLRDAASIDHDTTNRRALDKARILTGYFDPRMNLNCVHFGTDARASAY